MKRWTALAAVAAFGLGLGVAQASRFPVTSVDTVVKANPRGDKPIRWSEAAANDYVRLMVGEVKEWGYHSHAHETHLVVVMKGRGLAMVEGEMRDVKPGDVLTFAAGTRHSLEQKGKEPLVVLATWSAKFDPARDTTKHEMDHAHHHHHGHAVKPASATSTTRK